MKLIIAMLAALSMTAAHAFTIDDECMANPDAFNPHCKEQTRREINRMAEDPKLRKMLMGYRKENGWKDPCEGRKPQCWKE
ncbi:hypothetical protein LGM35_06490 [Burkholderia cenocepacia]|uniref:hypothetical protein n=1 Tax=Burkholderia cenocepacia TaxID=95486 RepID=UPI001CF39C03|nr:hypothetical protein [Burkholderia cenocepacia]MCA7922129.1 hypothetical protein [Burkholderia cenocepacia]